MNITSQDLKIKTISEDKYKGVFEFDPLPKGFGHTLGNTLRRVLLTAMPGAAITQISVEGANHQFTTLEGVKEDLVEIILNLKKIRFKKHSDNPEVAVLSVSDQGEVTAGQIETPSDLEVLNKNQHIATLSSKKSKLNIEMIVESGIGYSPSEERQTSKVGVIVIDALFSPVVRSNIEISETRAGGRTDLDKITLTVETDGSIKPANAVYKSAGILSEFFGVLEKWEQAEEENETELIAPTQNQMVNVIVDELPLQTRTINALKKAGVETLSQLARKTEEELADIKNLGEKSISEINKLLIKENLKEDLDASSKDDENEDE